MSLATLKTRQECLDDTKYKILRFLADHFKTPLIHFKTRTYNPDLVRACDAFCEKYAREIGAAADAEYLWRRAAAEEGEFRDGEWDNPRAHSVHMTEGERWCEIMRDLYKVMNRLRKKL